MTNYYEHKLLTYLMNITSLFYKNRKFNQMGRILSTNLNAEERNQLCKEISQKSKFKTIDKETNKDDIATFIDQETTANSNSNNNDTISKFQSFFQLLDEVQGQNEAREITMTISEFLKKKIDSDKPHVKTCEKIKEIQNVFKLNDIDVDILCLFYLKAKINRLDDLIESFIDEDIFANFAKQPEFISKVINQSISDISNSATSDSPLIKNEIINNNRGHYSLEHTIHTFLEKSSKTTLLDSFTATIDTADSFDLNDFQLSSLNLSLLKDIVQSKGSSSILIHGLPGTGKSELAKSLAKFANVNLIGNLISDKTGEISDQQRRTALTVIQNHPAIKDSIIVIDECDNILASQMQSKGWINDYLANNNHKIIWITNSIKNMDNSTARRFNLILKFDSLNPDQRANALRNVIKKHNQSFLSEDDIKSISKIERLSTGHYAIAYKTVCNMNIDNSQKNAYFKAIINEHLKTMGSPPLRLKSLSKTYSLDGLNMDQSPHLLIEQSKIILSRMQDSDCDINLNMILHGPPGSGKTEFVKYLGEVLGKDIVLKRASDLLSMFVGESEKNIREAFELAEKHEKILFIDEADSLISARENHSKTWETTQVNEILTCMENFRGMFICATNHIQNLDVAAQRRFLFKLKFDYLDTKGAHLFYKKFFNKYVENDLTPIQKVRLESMNVLTPNDFNNLKRKFELISPKNHDEILDQLTSELAYKIAEKRKLGFIN